MASRTLPVERVADRIKECVFENRVTLVIGKTGCGKSSRVPQLLQAELNGPIICTQPRRLAVVAIARHVAQLTGSDLGREVGFRIGQKSVASPKTKILFTTAGLLLEELRSSGPSALKKYSCLIVDELHERSVESDLLLACVHAMMVPGAVAAAAEPELPSIKLVLMSATANVERYKSYFKLPGEHVSLIQCDMENISSAIGQWLETVKHLYLDKVVLDVLAGHPNSVQHLGLLQQHKEGAITPQQQVDHPMQMLVRDLIIRLHQQERDHDAVILVFLPTYRALELQHRLLNQLKLRIDEVAEAAESLELFPLHSSVDIDEAMRSMQLTITPGHRKVILATNVAESSVTIPHVKHVIDACTTNQVYWDATSCRERARVIWASQSAADQRAGRTGRTCTGTCYRLMTKSSFRKLDRFEVSALTLRSLRREVLCLLSASSKSMADPEALLAQALDPPESGRVREAMEYLQTIGAARLNAKNRLEPSPVGSFIASLPIALDSALLFLRGGLQGHVWETAVIAALMNTTPYPIKQPFGSEAMQYVRRYYYGAQVQTGNGNYNGAAAAAAAAAGAAEWDGRDVLDSNGYTNNGSSSSNAQSDQVVDRTVQLLANLAAFESWQLHWCDLQRLKHMLDSSQHSSGATAAAADPATGDEDSLSRQGSSAVSDDGSLSAMSLLSAAVGADEAAWCAAHHLVPSSLRQVSDTLNIIVAAVHKFRPAFVNHVNGPPQYYLTTVPHKCHTQPVSADDTLVACDCYGLQVAALHAYEQSTALYSLLTSVSQGGTALADASLLTTAAQYSSSSKSNRLTSSSAGSNHISSNNRSSNAPDWASPSDAAAYGLIEVDPSDVSTSVEADTRPACKFYLSPSGCRNGWRCAFQHAQPTCVFYTSRSGCKYGAECRFLHEGTSSKRSQTSAAAADSSEQQQQQQQQQGLSFDWEPSNPSTYSSVLVPHDAARGYVLLLGEGDFTFTAALIKQRAAASGGASVPGAGIIAASYEQQSQLQQIYPGSALRERLKQLTAAGVDVQYGIDATRLEACLPHLSMTEVQHIVWNFPLAVSAEVADTAAAAAVRNSKLLGDDDEANRQLMGQFMAAVSRLMTCYNQDMQLHIALCLDQYGRWGVDQIARNNFLFLQQSKPFSVTEWRGYVPRRGLLDGGFPVDRAVVYSFALKLPAVLVPNPNTLGLRLRIQAVRALVKGSSPSKAADVDGKADRQQSDYISLTATSGVAQTRQYYALTAVVV